MPPQPFAQTLPAEWAAHRPCSHHGMLSQQHLAHPRPPSTAQDGAALISADRSRSSISETHGAAVTFGQRVPKRGDLRWKRSQYGNRQPDQGTQYRADG